MTPGPPILDNITYLCRYVSESTGDETIPSMINDGSHRLLKQAIALKMFGKHPKFEDDDFDDNKS